MFDDKGRVKDRIILREQKTGKSKDFPISETAAKAIKEHLATAYKDGKDITLIQKLFNHSSPAVTLAYIGITREDLDNVYLTLNL